MNAFDSSKLLESLRAGFISRNAGAENGLLPSLLVNDNSKHKKILSALERELFTCESFDFSVAFINDAGLACIMQTLEYLCRHNVKGRILTTNYLNFTSPGSLSKLLEFSNIEVRAYTQGGFHPKGYIFRQSNYYSIIIGSANLTASALSQNQEWSIHFLSCTDGQIVYSVREEFERVWNEAELVTPDWIDDYAIDYHLKKVKLQGVPKEVAKEISFEHELEAARIEEQTDDGLEIIPNSMQKEAMIALAQLREKNENRALLIAATGTGKTYLSIFDVKQVNPKKVLYVAHRDMILNKSEKSFKTLLAHIKTGFLNGTQKDTSADFLFASIFTLAKDDVLSSFKKDQFDYIIIDEVHHAGAASYQKIIRYFTPKFLLGLTATPERTDGFDIFELFHNNIPYEIRLQKALEENLLCPFHYYGLSDLTINGETIDDKSDFSKLTSDERIKHIEKEITLYKSNDCAVKGLIFCSRVDEAKELSRKLNQDGFHTTYLTGEHSDSEREKIIERLERDDDPLQYIISVDIFNEGVDIPCINQVVMLRPTQSAVIFVQQLGRGLRKDNGKQFVSVIDFIGNYENNFFIPIALFGDNSYNKDTLRRMLSEGSSGIPGTSTIQIDEIAKQKIFDSINRTNFSQLKLLKEEYTKLKMRLGAGKIPTMMDFVNNAFIDPLLFIDYSGSYYAFKCKIEKTPDELSPEQKCSLQFVSLEFARGIRAHELLILQMLLEKDSVTAEEFKLKLKAYDVNVSNAHFTSDLNGICNTLSPDFYTQADKKKYGAISYILYDAQQNKIRRTEKFSQLLETAQYKAELSDCLSYGLKRAALKENEIAADDNLVLYRKYTRKDVCKLLNWKSDCSSTIYGYKTETNYDEYACPIFVTYNKDDSISETTKYDDVFIDSSHFSWMSRSRRTSQSEEVAQIILQPENNIKVMLFVKKNDDEGSDFYYMGRLRYNSSEDTTMKNTDGKNVPVVNIRFDMMSPVPENLYNYFEN
ncbi:MAG: DEAD/DEAH box helicase [Treponema sp.]|nr:DEAD/DEAH box helicase [Treponema sp.]